MKLFDYLYISLNNIKRNKKIFLKNIILISIALTILIISSIATDTIQNIFDKNITYNISYRSIYVRNNDDTEETIFMRNLEKVNHISKVVSQEEYYVNVDTKLKNNSKTGQVSLLGANKDIEPSIILGRGFEEGEKNVCIIPKKFNPYYLDNNSEIIDGEKLLNEEIEIVYYNYDYSQSTPQRINTISEKFKVIGIYDPEINMAEYHECYINFEDVLNIQNEISKGSNYDFSSSSVIAIIDESNNVNQVITELKNLGYDVFLRSITNDKLIEIVKILSITISSSIIIISFISMIMSIVKISSEKKQELGLLKAFGYKKRNLWYIIIAESIINAIISFIISCISVLAIIMIIYYIVLNSNSELRRVPIIIKNNSFIFCFALSLVVSVLGNMLSNYKTVKESTIVQNMKE